MTWQPPIKPETHVGATGDNIFQIGANCRRLAHQLNWQHEWVEAFTKRLSASDSYAAALDVVREHFTLDEDAP